MHTYRSHTQTHIQINKSIRIYHSDNNSLEQALVMRGSRAKRIYMYIYVYIYAYISVTHINTRITKKYIYTYILVGQQQLGAGLGHA